MRGNGEQKMSKGVKIGLDEQAEGKDPLLRTFLKAALSLPSNSYNLHVLYEKCGVVSRETEVVYHLSEKKHTNNTSNHTKTSQLPIFTLI